MGIRELETESEREDNSFQIIRLRRIRAYTALITELMDRHSEESPWEDENQVSKGISFLSMEIEDLSDACSKYADGAC